MIPLPKLNLLFFVPLILQPFVCSGSLPLAASCSGSGGRHQIRIAKVFIDHNCMSLQKTYWSELVPLERDERLNVCLPCSLSALERNFQSRLRARCQTGGCRLLWESSSSVMEDDFLYEQSDF